MKLCNKCGEWDFNDTSGEYKCPNCGAKPDPSAYTQFNPVRASTESEQGVLWGHKSPNPGNRLNFEDEE